MTRLSGKKVLFLFTSLDVGGSERQAMLLARHLKEQHGAEVRVWGLTREPGSLATACDHAGIRWEAIPFSWPESRAGKITELMKFVGRLRREGPDILLPFNLLPCVVSGLTWRLSGAALNVWSHRNAGNAMALGRLQPLAVRLTPWFISNSEHGKRYLVETYGMDPRRVKVITNGVFLPQEADERSSWRRRLGISDDGFVAVMIANIHHPKDHPTLLKAWRRALDESPAEGNPRMTLVLAGRPDARTEDLKSLASDLNLGEQLRVLGWTEDISGLLRAADILLHSSRSEGMPNAVIEGMAAGLPVVATDIPGIREAVGPDGSRFLAPPGDPEALSAQILRFQRDGTLRKSVGTLMKDRAQRVFDPRLACGQTAEFLTEALDARQRSCLFRP